MRLFDPKANVTIVVEIKHLLELDDSREYIRYTHIGPPSGADYGGRCIGLDHVDGPGFVAGPPALPHESIWRRRGPQSPSGPFQIGSRRF